MKIVVTSNTKLFGLKPSKQNARYVRLIKFVSSCMVAVLVSALGSVVLKRFFRFQNATIIILSAVSHCLAELLRAMTRGQNMYWISSGLTKTGALVGPTIIAEMSNIVSSEDLGKPYYSFISIV